MLSVNSKYGRKSWEGIEDLREDVHRLAHLVYEADAEVRKQYPSSVATGFICAAMKNPSIAPTPEVTMAAEAQNLLYTLTENLVNGHGLDMDLVRAEYEPILNPTNY